MERLISYFTLSVLLNVFGWSRSQPALSTAEQHASFNRVLTNGTYDSRIRPHLPDENCGNCSFYVGKPTNVTVDIAINGFGEFNTANMDFSVSIYLRQRWNDPRLAFNAFNLSSATAITLSDKVLTDIWVPDLFFYNEKQGWKHDITTPNVLIRIAPSGDILYSQRISMKLSCLYDFYKFPMDSQTCRIEIHSYAYTTEDVNIFWKETDPIQRKDDLYLPEFTLESDSPKYCTTGTSTGEYPCIYAEFQLSRDMRYYVLNVYAPSFVVVIISFVNFMIDPRATPARVSIGVITVLTITTQSVTLQQRLPRVSYIKAVDVWMAVCLIFVVASMLEYAAANVMLQREARQKEKATRPEKNANIKKAFQGPMDNMIMSNIPLALPEIPEAVPLRRQKQCHVSADNLDFTPLHSKWNADNLDKLSRIAFTSAFLLFNVIYWCVYMLALV